MKRVAIWLVSLLGLSAAGWFGWQAQQKALNPQVQAAEGQLAGKSMEGKSADGRPGDAKGTDGKTPDGKAAGGKGPGGPGGGPPRGPVGVEVAKAEVRALVDQISAVGTLRAAESVVLKPEVAGRIEKLQFADGARVPKGALLVQLDAVVAVAEAEQARAELALSQANYQRTAELFDKKFVSERARDEAGANLKVLEAKLKVAQAKLSKSEVRAPFSGVMGLRNISVGDYVREGSELVLIEDTRQMKVDLRLPEKFLGQIKSGQGLSIAMDAFPGKKFAAKVQTIDSQVDANGRSLLVRTRIANETGVLRTGMFARADLVLQDKPNAIVVPEEAIVPMGESVIVYKIVDGKAMRTPIKTGLRNDSKVEILSGLEVGDTVIVAGQIKLPRDGMEVRVIDPSARRGQGGAGGPGKGSEGKGSESKGSEAKGPEAKPSEGKSADAKPAEGKQSEGKK